jgi:hypothetical protein
LAAVVALNLVHNPALEGIRSMNGIALTAPSSNRPISRNSWLPCLMHWRQGSFVTHVDFVLPGSQFILVTFR